MENIDIQSKSFVIKWIKLSSSLYDNAMIATESKSPTMGSSANDDDDEDDDDEETGKNGHVDTDINANEQFVKISWQLKPMKKSIDFSIYKKNTTTSNTTASPTNNSSSSHQSIDLNEKLVKNGLVELKRYNDRLKQNEMFEDCVVLETSELTNDNTQPIYLAFVFNNEHCNKKNRVLFSCTTSLVDNVKNVANGTKPNSMKYMAKYIERNGKNRSNSSSSSTSSSLQSDHTIEDTATAHNNGDAMGTAKAIIAHNNTDSSFASSASSSTVATNSSLSSSSSFSSSSSSTMNQPGGHHSSKPYYTNNKRYFQGYMLKKRRKKLQGFTRRFFKIDYKDGTLSYYVNEALQGISRGEVVVKLCVISADKLKKLIVLDSGFELWYIKTYTPIEWKIWCEALSKASLQYPVNNHPTRMVSSATTITRSSSTTTRSNNITTSPSSSPPSPTDSNSKTHTTTTTADSDLILKKLHIIDEKLENVTHMENKSKRNFIIKEVSQLTNEIKKHFLNRKPESSKDKLELPKTISHSDETISIFSNAEYYDATDKIPGVILIKKDEDVAGDTHDMETVADSKVTATESPSSGIELLVQDNDMWPVALEEKPFVKRRNDVSPSKTQPPTLLSFLRKNVGKDLSSISMPVTSNEPITILQYMAESFEYAKLLNKCFPSTSDTSLKATTQVERLAYVTAFAISNLSLQRAKTRCARKPFSPLLTETYELCRDDLGFKFLAEKVEHKPHQMFALHAQSRYNWEIDYILTPSQKFWGKSIELNNIGIFNLKFIDSKTSETLETYQWTTPTTVLKNIIAGERFVEPMGLFEVHCLETKWKSSCDFKSTGGFFKGRSEDVNCNLYQHLPKTHGFEKIGEIQGTWTKCLKLMPSNTTIWECGELVPNPEKKYGFTKFSANLNEITALEKGNLPPTDSRLRPDVRSYENGDVDSAEELKKKLEQSQRERRELKKDYKPHFFTKVSTDPAVVAHKNDLQEDVSKHTWKFVTGGKSYWNRRKLQNWKDIEPLW